MDIIINFFSQYGLVLTLFALAGVVGLGVMKYCNLFSKFDEKTRHYLYVGISILFSMLCILIYQLCTNTFELSSFLTTAGVVFTLNQTFYNIFCTLTLKELFIKILDNIVKLLSK